MNRLRNATLILTLLFATACSTTPPRGGYYQDDGPHDTIPVDLNSVSEPVPRPEPLSAQGNKPYTVFGKTYRPRQTARGYFERGVASWYGKKFHGRRTSNGETYNMYAMTAAHKTLPLPSYARVRNLTNGKSVVVRINDRGPFLHNRLIDLSYAAADKLGIAGKGTGLVEVVGIAPGRPETWTANATTVAHSKPSAAEGKPLLFLQVGAFAERANAESLRARLEHRIPVPVRIQSRDDSARGLFRVRLGPLATVDEADGLARRVTDYGVADAIIVVE